MEYEIREIQARRMLAVGGSLAEIAELWHRCGEGREAGWLTSAEVGVTAIGYVRIEDGERRYYAGVPVDPSAATPPGAASEGFALLDLPAGRYAIVRHRGPTAAMYNIAVALQAAARAAGEQPDGVELELYHPTSGDPEADVDMGARLVAES